MALTEAVTAGWPAEQAYVILGGFQGEKMKDKNSLFYAVEDRIPRVYPWMNEPLKTIARVYDVFTFGQLQLEL